MKKAKEIIMIITRIILMSVLVAMIILVGCNIVLNIKKNSGDLQPSILGFAPMSIEDNNLSPEVNKDDFLLIMKCDEYQIGDIVTFERNGNYITQKVIAIDYYEGRDDVRQYYLSYCSVLPNSIYGKMVVKLSGWVPVVEFFQSVPGISVLIVIVFLLIFLPTFLGWGKIEDEKDKLPNQNKNKKRAYALFYFILECLLSNTKTNFIYLY